VNIILELEFWRFNSLRC